MNDEKNRDIRDLAGEYAALFGNLDEVCHPAVMFEPAFRDLLARAVASGTALTRGEVEKVFPGVAWDW